MRMNLNQQSHGYMWDVNQNLMKSLSPIVDCSVHYIDVMCQMKSSKPIQVSAIGASLTGKIPIGTYNYDQFQIRFEDGSIGWYEAGWGRMISETAFFIKDVIDPKGSVFFVAKEAGGIGKSDSIASHTKTESLRSHHAALDQGNAFLEEDTGLIWKMNLITMNFATRNKDFFTKQYMKI